MIEEACFGRYDEANSQELSLCSKNSRQGEGKYANVRFETGPGTSSYSRDCIDPNGDGLKLCEGTHGTATATVAAGSNNVPWNHSEKELWGVAPDSKLILIKIGAARYWWSASVHAALGYVNDVLAKRYPGQIAAVNFSGGSNVLVPDGETCTDTVVGPTAGALKEKGVAVVVSSGNDGEHAATTLWSCADDVVTVGATGVKNMNEYTKLYPSNASVRNQLLSPVGNAAWNDQDSSITGASWPEATPNDVNEDWLIYPGGTSFAAPQVTGAFAVLREKYGQSKSVDDLVALMQQTGVPAADTRDGGKHITTPRLWLADAVGKRTDPSYDFAGDGTHDFPVVAADWKKTLVSYKSTNAGGLITEETPGRTKPPYRVIADRWDSYDQTTAVFDFMGPGTNGFITLSRKKLEYHAYDRALQRVGSAHVIGEIESGKTVKAMTYAESLPNTVTGDRHALVLHYSDGQVVARAKDTFSTQLLSDFEVVPAEAGRALISLL